MIEAAIKPKLSLRDLRESLRNVLAFVATAGIVPNIPATITGPRELGYEVELSADATPDAGCATVRSADEEFHVSWKLNEATPKQASASVHPGVEIRCTAVHPVGDRATPCG